MGLFGRSSTLFWPGCYSSAVLKDKVSNYKKIMRKLGISFSTTDKIHCCAGILINAGYDREARQIARENLEILKSLGIKKIITSCPLCYKTFSQDYEKILPEWDIQVEFILISIFNKIYRYSGDFENIEKGEIVYHDSCYLGRYSKIFQEPRDILKILGYDLVELIHNKQDSICIGACANLKQTNPELANQIAKNLIKEITRIKATKIVTLDPQAYIHLKENLEATNINVFEFSDILCEALGIKT